MSSTNLTQQFSYTSKKLKRDLILSSFLFYTVDYVSELPDVSKLTLV